MARSRFGFGKSGHVLHGVAFRRSGLAAFRGFLHGLSRLIEEAPNAFRNAGDRGYGIGDQIPGDIERDFRRLLRGLRELLCLRHRLQLSDRVDFRDATHEHRVAVGFKDPEVGVDRVVVRAGVSRHGIPHGKVRPLEILRLQNHAGVERRQRLVDDRRRGCGWDGDSPCACSGTVVAGMITVSRRIKVGFISVLSGSST